ncbi:hypothetical protein PLICRDRAFT_175431 [Plicaturopsis crispa FD-325 SS-3]|nr:hypothetical protein PLICRDRAFT_175431 [Plicaturopsis crispa FD-325 SS-3]
MLAGITPFLIFVAFILLLLVSLSVPIIKSIFLFRLTSETSSSLLNSGASGSVKFGVWGYCTSAVDVTVAGIDHSTGSTCTKAHLGYTFDQTVANVLRINDIENWISKVTTAALVLHPVACGLSFLAFLISLHMTHRAYRGVQTTSRLASFFTLAFGLLAALVTTVVFLIDVIFVAVVRNKVHDHTSGSLDLTWGNAVWMALGATVALWVSLLGACAGIFSCGRRYRKHAY